MCVSAVGCELFSCLHVRKHFALIRIDVKNVNKRRDENEKAELIVSWVCALKELRGSGRIIRVEGEG